MNLQNVKILVAERKRNLGTVSLLASAGYTVLHAGSGGMTLEMVYSAKPDLLLLDLDLPGIDSLTICRRIKMDSLLRSIFVVIRSSSPLTDETRAAGADEYLPYPLSDHDFLDRIRTMVHGKKAEDALRHADFDLEKRVRDRTSELSVANQQLVREYDTLKTVNAILHLSHQTSLPLEVILNQTLEILAAITWVVSISQSAIFLTGDDPQTLVLKAHHGMNADTATACREVPVGHCLCGRAASTKILQFSSGPQEGHENTPRQAFSHGHFAVPILSANIVLGVLTIYLPAHLPKDHGVEAFLTAVANALASVLARKQAEEALVASEEGYRSLLDSSPDPIIVYDMENRITYINPVFERVFGWRKQELIHQNVEQVLGMDWPDTQSMVEKMIHQNGVYLHETRYCTKSGQEIDVQISAALYIYQHMKKAGTIVTLRDISDRKRAQRLYLEKEAAEAANRAKSEFLANMSHELRTPLNAVIGFSEVLQDKYFGALNAKQENYLRMITESGQHLLSLINDVLDLSKIESGKMQLEYTPVRIHDFLGAGMEMIQQKARGKHIEIHFDIADSLRCLEIMADARCIKQIVFNLFSNAVKFTPEGGRITVRMRRIGRAEPWPDPKNFAMDADHIEIAVEDNGIGIAGEEQEKIFQEFYQIQGGYRDKTPGTGLGLPLSRRFIEMHKGRLFVESPGLNQGSRFVIWLPLEPPDPPPGAKTDLPGMRIGSQNDLLLYLERLIEKVQLRHQSFTLGYFQTRLTYLQEKTDIAMLLNQSKRAHDYLAVDTEGTFYLVLENIDPVQSENVMARSREKIERLLKSRKVSYGMAIFPADGWTSSELLEKLRGTREEIDPDCGK